MEKEDKMWVTVGGKRGVKDGERKKYDKQAFK